MAGEAPVHEVFLGGATGTGKTLTGNVTVMYQAYCFDCFRQPQVLFNLAPATHVKRRSIGTPYRRAKGTPFGGGKRRA